MAIQGIIIGMLFIFMGVVIAYILGTFDKPDSNTKRDSMRLIGQNLNFLTFAHDLYSDSKMNPGVDMTSTLNHISDCINRTTDVTNKLRRQTLNNSDVKTLIDINADCRKLYATLPSNMRTEGFEKDFTEILFESKHFKQLSTKNVREKNKKKLNYGLSRKQKEWDS
tara:strand:+ start:206 stop:706 length:501 start_codon:yes stop_codon:yes gene_type:complete